MSLPAPGRLRRRPTCRCPTAPSRRTARSPSRPARRPPSSRPLLGWAAERGIELQGLTVIRPTLEDVYLELTASEARRTDERRRAELALLARWTRVRLTIYLRTPRAAFFTFVFPLILLVLLNSVNSGTDVTSTATGEKVSFATYFTPSIGDLRPDHRLLHGDHLRGHDRPRPRASSSASSAPRCRPRLSRRMGVLGDHHRLLLGRCSWSWSGCSPSTSRSSRD